jgi:hypothetical protein
MITQYLKNHAISLLSDSKEDCKIYANESRLIDFAMGVKAERQELLRWRDSLKEIPEHRQIVLVKLAKDCFDVCMYDIYLEMFIGIEDRYKQDNAYDWRPIIEEE